MIGKNSNETAGRLENITPTAINKREGYITSSGNGFDYLGSAKASTIDVNGNKILVSEEELYNKNKEYKDILSFIKGVSMCTKTTSINGTDYYIVDSSTAGVLSVGPSIVLKYNGEYFKKYGYDVSNMKDGDVIPVSIIDCVTKDILADKRKYVNSVLSDNGINNLTDYQIDALVSRAYSVGNISDFPSAYKKYGNTEELYSNYLGTVTGAGTVYEKELTDRRNAEIELFKNGYSKEEENVSGTATDAFNKYLESRGIDPNMLINQNNSILKNGVDLSLGTGRIGDDPTGNVKVVSDERIGDDPTGIVRDTSNERIGDDPTGTVKVVSASKVKDPLVEGTRVTNNSYTENDVNKMVSILWHEYGGSLSGNYENDCFLLLNLACTIINNAYAYGGAGNGKSVGDGIVTAIGNKPYLYQGGQNYIYSDFNPKNAGASDSTCKLLRAVAEKTLSGEYSLPSNLRGQSARYIMDGYSNFNTGEHYLQGNEWYSDVTKDFVIYPLNENKTNDKAAFTTELSDYDVYGNKLVVKDVNSYKTYADKISSDIRKEYNI